MNFLKSFTRQLKLSVFRGNKAANPSSSQKFTFSVRQENTKITTTTYTIEAASAKEARAKFWLYWCDSQPLKVDSHTECYATHVTSCPHTDMMDKREAEILTWIITDLFQGVMSFPSVQKILKSIKRNK